MPTCAPSEPPNSKTTISHCNTKVTKEEQKHMKMLELMFSVADDP